MKLIKFPELIEKKENKNLENKISERKGWLISELIIQRNRLDDRSSIQ